MTASVDQTLASVKPVKLGAEHEVDLALPVFSAAERFTSTLAKAECDNVDEDLGLPVLCTMRQDVSNPVGLALTFGSGRDQELGSASDDGEEEHDDVGGGESVLLSNLQAPIAAPGHLGGLATGAFFVAAPSSGNLAQFIKSIRRAPPGSTAVRLPQNVLDLFTFGDSPELLRGTPVTTALQNFAAIFGSSAGSARTHNLSRQVRMLDTFVSHNWVTSRWSKYLVLLLHFNFRIAVIVYSICSASFVFLNLYANAPVYKPTYAYPEAVLGVPLCIPVAMATLLFLREVMPKHLPCGRFVFVDKVCIHQTDADLKRRSIEKLGAYLCESNEMLVVFTENYLRKLWTTYEMACFLTLHHVEKLVVLPPESATNFLFAVFCIYAQQVLSLGSRAVLQVDILVVILVDQMVTLVFISVYFAKARQFARTRATDLASISNFAVRNCTCFDEADRAVVYKNIADMIRWTNLQLGTAASEEACLDAFDEQVRLTLPDALAKAMPKSIMTPKHEFFVSILFFLPDLIDAVGGLAHGMPWRHLAALAATKLFLIGYGGPVTLRVLNFCGSCRLDLRGKCNLAFSLCACLLALILVGVFVLLPLEICWRLGRASDTGLTIVSVFSGIVSAATMLALFGPVGSLHRRLRLRQWCQTICIGCKSVSLSMAQCVCVHCVRSSAMWGPRPEAAW